jgi:hypothetical protein
MIIKKEQLLSNVNSKEVDQETPYSTAVKRRNSPEIQCNEPPTTVV